MMANQTVPVLVTSEQPDRSWPARTSLIIAAVIVLVVVCAGAVALYFINRGPHWEPYISGDGFDSLRHYYPVTVTAAERTPGIDAGMISVQARSDLSTNEPLQCAAFVGPKAPRYEPLWGDAIDPVTYSTVNPYGFNEVELGTLTAGQTRTIRLWVAPRTNKHAPITPKQTTVVCYAEHQTNDQFQPQ